MKNTVPFRIFDGGFLNFGGCFVAGTPVHVVASPASVLARQIAWSGANGAESYQYLVSSFDSIDVAESFTVAIEEVPLGSRIGTNNPEPWTVQRSVATGDEANLRVITAEVIRDDGTHVGIELLRSVEYINQLGLIAGGRLYMELEELNVAGWVQLHSIEPCPPLCDGPGNLVTGRFVTVQAANIVRATFSDGTILTGTDIHPVWSLDKQDWVPLGELCFGEQVHSNAGLLSLVDREVITRPQDVYNIEVDGQHVYQVGDSGVLVHNTCAGHHHFAPRAFGSNVPYGPKHLNPALSQAAHTNIHRGFSDFLKRETGHYFKALSGRQWQTLLTKRERMDLLVKFHKTYNGGSEWSQFVKEIVHARGAGFKPFG